MRRRDGLGRYVPGEIASLAERFWSKVNKNGPIPTHRPDLGPCWLWTGAKTSKGYGSFREKSRVQPRPAHIIAYELEVGPVPSGRQLDHLCRVHPCVNPGHVEPVASRTNTLRGETAAARFAARTHCPQGHPFAGANLGVIRAGGKERGRYCRACHNARERARYQAAKPHAIAS